MAKDIDPRLKALIDAVTQKRARCVIDHILKHGQITNEDLKNLYGYNHPPRAACDVREHGIPLKTIRVRAENGRAIGAYIFGDPDDIKDGRMGGRKAFSKAFKQELISKYGSRCTITGERLEDRYLQIDHRIHYGVGGDSVDDNKVEDFMLLDASAQRAKSFSCEACENFLKLHDPNICKNCFWASPENYDHVAIVPKRTVTMTWSGDEIAQFNKLKVAALKQGQTVQDYVKSVLLRHQD